jgi:hypothetical protein
MNPTPPKPEPAVLLHENLTLLEFDRPRQLQDLQDLPAFRAALVKIVNDRTVVLDSKRLPELLTALEKHGHRPRVDSGTGQE